MTTALQTQLDIIVPPSSHPMFYCPYGCTVELRRISDPHFIRKGMCGHFIIWQEKRREGDKNGYHAESNCKG